MKTRLRFRKAGMYWRTLKHLRPSQVLWRVRLRVQRRAVRVAPRLLERAWSTATSKQPAGWPTTFVPLDALRFSDTSTAESIRAGQIPILDRLVDVNTSWSHPALPQLWRYHLHYWDWAWHVVNKSDPVRSSEHLRRLWTTWKEQSPYGLSDAWSPYVVSLRLWTLCGLTGQVEADHELTHEMSRQIERELGYLRANLEYDVGGNHLVKNLKAVIGASVFTGHRATTEKALGALLRQLEVQILGDGGHYERSPAYHAQVLGDLIDVSGLLELVRIPCDDIRSRIESMRSWLAAMTGPDGWTPCFNDGASIGIAELDRLGVDWQQPQPRLRVLPESGYVIARPSPTSQFVMDVGRPCPPDLPAHAHAACLSFELMWNGERIVVNSGTSEYGDGVRRSYERSTSAHTTLEIDGENQTEVWGAFRAGRRANARLLTAEDDASQIVIEAEHDGYSHLPGSPVHARKVEITDQFVDIHDSVRGSGNHYLQSQLFVPGNLDSMIVSKNEARTSNLTLAGTHAITAFPETHARAFGDRRPVVVVSQQASRTLPSELRWRLTPAASSSRNDKAGR